MVMNLVINEFYSNFRFLETSYIQSPGLTKLGVKIWPIASSAETFQLSECLTICQIKGTHKIKKTNSSKIYGAKKEMF